MYKNNMGLVTKPFQFWFENEYRSGDVLKVQDFNVVMRQLGNQNRLKDLSQVNFSCLHIQL